MLAPDPQTYQEYLANHQLMMDRHSHDPELQEVLQRSFNSQHGPPPLEGVMLEERHAKLEALDEQLAKGEINEGEYITQTRALANV